MIHVSKCSNSILFPISHNCPCEGTYSLILQNTATRETFAGYVIHIESNTLRMEFAFKVPESMCPGTYEYYLTCGDYDWSKLFKDDIKCSTFARPLAFDCKLLAVNCKLLADGAPTSLKIISRGLLQYCDEVNEKIIASKRKYDGFKS